MGIGSAGETGTMVSREQLTYKFSHTALIIQHFRYIYLFPPSHLSYNAPSFLSVGTFASILGSSPCWWRVNDWAVGTNTRCPSSITKGHRQFMYTQNKKRVIKKSRRANFKDSSLKSQRPLSKCIAKSLAVGFLKSYGPFLITLLQRPIILLSKGLFKIWGIGLF